jgi:outer membrane receptor protein involved in Fe transport
MENNMRIFLGALALAACIFGPCSISIFAQNGDTAANQTTNANEPSDTRADRDAKQATEMSLEDLANVEVYSASKRLQSASDAPASVTVVTADDIQRHGYRTLTDILEAVRGFYVTYDRDYSFVGVRGFGRLGDWNSRILVLIDGHRINDNVLGNAMLGSEFLVDVDMIERVEIVRGPPTMELPAIPTMRAISTFLPPSATTPSHCRGCLARATRECQPATTGPNSTILRP